MESGGKDRDRGKDRGPVGLIAFPLPFVSPGKQLPPACLSPQETSLPFPRGNTHPRSIALPNKTAPSMEMARRPIIAPPARRNPPALAQSPCPSHFLSTPPTRSRYRPADTDPLASTPCHGLPLIFRIRP